MNQKIRWGVIGAGGIADRRTIPGMMLCDNAELVAVMEINMELAEKLREKEIGIKAELAKDESYTDKIEELKKQLKNIDKKLGVKE